MSNETTHVFVMARGQGTRLYPLTDDTYKPSVCFAGQYRIIDFVLSNLEQSGIQNITVLTPKDGDQLCRHIQKHWSNVRTYTVTTDDSLIGNATSVLQALRANIDEYATHIGIFPSDQVFHFNLRETLLQHRSSSCKASILTRWHRSDSAYKFGVLRAENNTIIDFIEKPKALPKSYLQNDLCRVNMGIYWFNRTELLKILLKDALDPGSSNDFGHDVLPLLIKEISTHFIDIDSSTPWEDVGTIACYWTAHWKYKSVLHSWNIRETISGSILKTGYTSSPIPTTTQIDQCIIGERVVIGEYCTLKQVIVDAGCVLDNHLDISLDTPISGTVYKTLECLIIPKNSIVKYNYERQIITVEQP